MSPNSIALLVDCPYFIHVPHFISISSFSAANC